MKGSFLTLVKSDYVKAIIMAFIGSAATVLYKFIEMGTFPTGKEQWKQILLAGTGAAVTYLIKNFFTNSNDQFGKAEPK
jgi:hypothetical protein